MDFLDLPVLVSDESDALPQPASRLSLANLDLKDEQQQLEFTLPDIDAYHGDDQDLQSKMQKYAQASLVELRSAHTVEGSGEGIYSNTSVEKNDTTNQLLSSKINKLINVSKFSNYTTDSETKQALQNLESSILTLGIDFNQLTASDFIGTVNRRSLRSKLENTMLNSHSDILNNFQSIARRIKRLSEPLEKINSAMVHFKKTKDCKSFNFNSTKDSITKMKSRRKVIMKLKDTLTLNQMEADHLQNGVIDDEFFRVLNKIHFIKEKATYLLSTDQTLSAGNALLEKMNAYLTVSNKRIYNFLVDFIDEYDTLSRRYGERTVGEDSLHRFQMSIVHLSNDLQFFQDFLQKIVTLRSKRLLDDFLSQFDIDNKKLQRPIILSAHDPVRYLGDVLAYVHSMIVNELEFLRSIFELQPELITSDSVLKDNMEFVVDLHVKLLNQIFASLTNTIRIRLEQIVRFENDPLLNLDIVQCLNLYQMMLVKNGIKKDSQIVTTLQTLENLSRSKILISLTSYLNDLTKDQPIPSDLLPPDWFAEYLQKLTQLFAKLDKQHENQILTKEFFDKLILEPVNNSLLPHLQSWFPTAKKELSAKIELLISQVNALDLLKSKLAAFHGTIFQDGYGNEVYVNVQSQYQAYVEKLKEAMNKYLLDSTGTELYFNLFNMIFPIEAVEDELDYDMYLSVTENPIMKLSSIHENIHSKLNEYLPLALTDFQDIKLFNLMPPSVEEEIVLTSFKNFVKFYKVFRTVLSRIYPEDLETIFATLNFTPEEVVTLLGVDHTQ